jgi:micrococcal nuclease
MGFKLTKKHQRILITLIIMVILPLLGLGAVNRDELSEYVNTQNPGFYEVTKVLDGDTISVKAGNREETVRMIGVDTPETHHPKKPVQCFGRAASDFTKKLIGSNQIRLEADPTDDNKDIYGRLLRYVYLPNGILVNKEIISEGYGFAYTVFPFTKLEEFRAAALTARENKKGLWASCEIDESEEALSTGAE